MKYILTLFAIALVIQSYSQNKAGTLDKSFGDAGIVINNPKGFHGNDIKIQSDNKILLAGSSINGLTILRYLPDGDIDYGFGDSGMATAPVLFYAQRMVVTNEGKILTESNAGFDYNIILTQFTNEGKIDSSFGNNGILVIDFGKIEYPGELALQKDGKIIIFSTYITDINNPDPVQFMLRLNTNGSFDDTFGNNGIILNNFSSSYNGPRSMVIQPDDKILIGGNISTEFEEKDFSFWRYNADGSLDNSFGTNGNVVTNYSEYDDVPYSLALQEDGKIVAGGIGGYQIFGSDGYLLFIRYNANGSLDKSFGNNGATTANLENFAPSFHKVLIDNKGNSFGICGATDVNSINRFALIRLNPDGIIDSSFGVHGIQMTIPAEYLEVTDGELQNEKIMALGNAYLPNINGLFPFTPILARYNNDDLSKKQIIIAKIRKWLQHRNGIIWDDVPGAKTYAVQRSSNGVSWTTVFKISKANSQQLTANNYADPSPLTGTNYYRLQATGVDGAVTYSNVIAISNEENDISIYPNPAKNFLHVEGLSSIKKTKLIIVDITGNIKLTKVVNNASIDLNITTLKPGNYILKIENDNFTAIRKFLKD